MGKTLRRYLLREIGGAFLAGIAVFSSVLFLLRTVDLIEMIFARGVPAPLVLRLLAAIFPSFLEATLPMAFLLGVVAALGRLASDHETVALRAAGLSPLQLLPPVVLLSAVVAIASLSLSMTARPWGHREIERTTFEMARTRASAAIRPRFFNTDFERMVVFVDRIEQDSGDLVGVLLSDERDGDTRSTVFAKRGRVGAHRESGRLYLHLLDGSSVASKENSADYDVTNFRSLEVRLELRSPTGSRPISNEPASLVWGQLSGDHPLPPGLDRREADIEMQRRFSVAAAAVLLGLLGTGLGMHPATATRSRAVALSIATILVFQGLVTASVAAARSTSLPPPLAMWIPNLLLAAAAAWLLSRTTRNRPLLPLSAWRSRSAGTEPA